MSEHLNCDAEGCSHVEQVSEITEDHVGMPCPVCGANLLTREDWEAWKPIQAVLRQAKAMAESSGALPDAAPPQGASVHVRHHGGKTTIELERPLPPKQLH